ncbi:hypothetical protein ACTID9_04830 [Brevibacillus fluminis]|uniref:hypothetical protein n=1 Tax=Brevibacillus fluminis TaxID=511487 RepID=UPI003F8C2698
MTNEVQISLAQTKKAIVTNLYHLIKSVPDDTDRTSVVRLLTYLNGLLRIKIVTPPTAEIMALIKAQKPTLYNAARRALFPSSHLYMLFQIDMDPKLAVERLSRYVEEL